ncbi:MAG TPA: CDP-alcohol phosphatidyltransferase family protein, partial [Solirubrobacteraceae bacterium]|nr:CDP-alcohol phosphatidyltransferase family protein [Solirubrobacteraceae bacterium]
MEAKQAAAVPWARQTTVHIGPATGLIAQVLLLTALAGAVGMSGGHLSHAGWIVGISCGVVMNAALARGLSHYRSDGLSPADWVTLARGTLVGGVAALVADSFVQPVQVKTLVSLAALALVLDAVDGWVARRTRTAALGAQFDGEVDAFLILVLSVYVARSAGAWVLAIGLARYAFLVAGWLLPWMRASLPPRFWRKVVAAAQGIVLTVAAAEVLPPALATAALIGALILLAESFGHDVLWLQRHRPRVGALIPAGPGPTPDPATGDTGEPSHGPVRRTITIVFTVLAALAVWAILVAPDQPGLFTPSHFARLPLEGLVLIALALLLPRRGRRILAVTVGVTLTLLIVLKVINYQMFSLYDRPYDPLGDTTQLGNGIETLRSLVGGTETKLIEVGTVLGTIGLVVVLTLAMLRLNRVAAEHRRWALR